MLSIYFRKDDPYRPGVDASTLGTDTFMSISNNPTLDSLYRAAWAYSVEVLRQENSKMEMVRAINQELLIDTKGYEPGLRKIGSFMIRAIDQNTADGIRAALEAIHNYEEVKRASA